VECHNTSCHADEGYCPNDGVCYWGKDGWQHCCSAGQQSYGTAGCCHEKERPFAWGGCCPYGSVPYGFVTEGTLERGCCDPGEKAYGSAGCCPTGKQPHALHVCCNAGYKPWQLDDGTMTCCEFGKICPRTENPIETGLPVDHDEE